MGGRALTTRPSFPRKSRHSCHPLGEPTTSSSSPRGFSAVPAAAMSGRISVGCKSPLTGGIKEANAGGQASQMLGRLGLCGHRARGQAQGRRPLQDPHQQGRGRRSQADNSLKMLGNYDLVEKMKAEYGDKIACISIGPAG
ncbi:MAG: hypothetical protein MZV70_05360 [Desulfobacterales bacterium]|nr:hypothetical protein [Desulfobacterales bacterium]